MPWGDFVSKFAQLNDDVLFDEVWSREGELTDNMDLLRLSEVRPEDLERAEKYKRAYAILEEADSRQRASA